MKTMWSGKQNLFDKEFVILDVAYVLAFASGNLGWGHQG